MCSLRILVVDDHEIVRRGVCELLTNGEVLNQRQWTICGEGENGFQAIELTRQLSPDVVVLDIGMPYMNGITASRMILQENPSQRIVVFSGNDSEQVIWEAVQAGVQGYVLKCEAGDHLVRAVAALQVHRQFFGERVKAIMQRKIWRCSDPEPQVKHLSVREQQVAQLLASGKSTKEIALLLQISVKTAETHRSNLMRKMRLHSLSEVVLYAVRNNLVQLSEIGPSSA